MEKEQIVEKLIKQGINNISLWKILTDLRANYAEFLGELTNYFDLVVANNPNITGYKLITESKKKGKTILIYCDNENSVVINVFEIGLYFICKPKTFDCDIVGKTLWFIGDSIKTETLILLKVEDDRFYYWSSYIKNYSDIHEDLFLLEKKIGDKSLFYLITTEEVPKDNIKEIIKKIKN